MTNILTDPDYFPWRINTQTRAVEFHQISRAQIVEAAFLDHRAPGASNPKTSLSVAALKNESDSQKTPRSPAYIFHTAFCASTLICRCLDQPGNALSLREPQILMDLSGARRFEGQSGQALFNDSFQQINMLMSRPHEGNERAIIKPSNGANDLLVDVLKLMPDAPVLLLFTQLRPFLISVLKRGEQGRLFVRSLLHHPWGTDPRLQNMPKEQALGLTDLQACALVWFLQTETFAKALANHPSTRIRALRSDEFQQNPTKSLNAIDDFFGLSLGAKQIDETIKGPLFMQDAKHQDRDYDPSARAGKMRAIEDIHGADLDRTMAWAQKLSPPNAKELTSTLLR